MSDFIKTEIIDGKVGVIRLDRPDALNALCGQLMDELSAALDIFEADENIGCMIITGNEKAFAAGADIKEMQSKSFSDVYVGNMLNKNWERLLTCRKPVIAAVAGYALGGGCELAMMCDILLAADNAKFGQPEIKIGTLPGIGGTQRLTRLIGKPKAMEMCLTGRMIGAEEAVQAGLAARVVPLDKLMDEALEAAKTIADMSLPAVMMVKEAVNRAYETTLAEGLHFERRLFYASFATEDQKEGMQAFIEKRAANFSGK
ncbi:MAG: enoyl-CoA hydratase [Pseudomonadota bacterium]|jgi:enoyl-CoA hydratase|nr:enoyl-CoA hydratase [Pseudomonadota bacterium]QKK05182.1 MAG: enoyl-CoA hydratase [Pseudomonadota bacterium]